MVEALLERNYEYKTNSPDLPGFNVSGEIDGLAKYRDITEIEMNIRHYIREYAKQGLVLPNLVYLNEEGKLVNLSGIPLVPRITAEERMGAILEASIKVESFINEGMPGSMAVITSPRGPSGMKDQNDEAIDYPMTQTLIFIKEANGYLKSVNLVSDLTINQNKELREKLGTSGGNIFGINEMEDLAQIVRNPALLGPNSGYSLAGILDEILRIRGDSDIVLEKPGGKREYRLVQEYKRDLLRFEELLTFDENAENCISEFKKFVKTHVNNLDNLFVRKRLERELYNTILKIVGTLDEFKRSRNTFTSFSAGEFGMTQSLIRDDDYGFGKEMAFLQTKIGCNGSGSSNVRVLMGVSSGLGGVIGSENSLSGKCSKCGVNHAVLGGCGFCDSCEGEMVR